MLQSLYNTEISETRAVGYCKKHHCYVTSTQIKQKECLSKQCFHLEKKEHEYWRQRELTKARRKIRKENLLCR
jgi:hypothetical protein